jgi:phospholipid/cholesterol/gamma-HCH transport system ATP-binding protein
VLRCEARDEGRSRDYEAEERNDADGHFSCKPVWGAATQDMFGGSLMHAQPSDGAAIEVRGLVAHYGTRKILDDVNFEAGYGQIMVIMGGSGSGKSTLLRHLLGLNRPTAGSIRLLGKDITRLTADEMYQMRRNMGVSFQGGALFNSMTVGENVALPLVEHTRLDLNTIRIMARMKLEVVNLAGFEDFMPSQLSGGMVKRAALARAIVMDPRLLFFDEPSAGLDPVVSAELDELILTLRDAMKMTIVVVTHELESAFKIADYITVLDAGRVLMTDTADAVRASDNARIQDLLNRRPRHQDVDPEAYMRRLTGEAA